MKRYLVPGTSDFTESMRKVRHNSECLDPEILRSVPMKTAPSYMMISLSHETMVDPKRFGPISGEKGFSLWRLTLFGKPLRGKGRAI